MHMYVCNEPREMLCRTGYSTTSACIEDLAVERHRAVHGRHTRAHIHIHTQTHTHTHIQADQTHINTCIRRGPIRSDAVVDGRRHLPRSLPSHWRNGNPVQVYPHCDHPWFVCVVDCAGNAHCTCNTPVLLLLNSCVRRTRNTPVLLLLNSCASRSCNTPVLLLLNSCARRSMFVGFASNLHLFFLFCHHWGPLLLSFVLLFIL